MALIDLDKFVASFITEIKKNHMVITYNIPSCIKKALEDQGLDYKGGEIIKTQCRVSAEAKENGYGESDNEKVINEIINTVTGYHPTHSSKEIQKMVDWLEKQEQKPQSHWKPSDEQMEALDSAIDEYDGYPEFDSLVSLKNDLKKL